MKTAAGTDVNWGIVNPNGSSEHEVCCTFLLTQRITFTEVSETDQGRMKELYADLAGVPFAATYRYQLPAPHTSADLHQMATVDSETMPLLDFSNQIWKYFYPPLRCEVGRPEEVTKIFMLMMSTFTERLKIVDDKIDPASILCTADLDAWVGQRCLLAKRLANFRQALGKRTRAIFKRLSDSANEFEIEKAKSRNKNVADKNEARAKENKPPLLTAEDLDYQGANNWSDYTFPEQLRNICCHMNFDTEECSDDVNVIGDWIGNQLILVDHTTNKAVFKGDQSEFVVACCEFYVAVIDEIGYVRQEGANDSATYVQKDCALSGCGLKRMPPTNRCWSHQTCLLLNCDQVCSYSGFCNGCVGTRADHQIDDAGTLKTIALLTTTPPVVNVPVPPTTVVTDPSIFSSERTLSTSDMKTLQDFYKDLTEETLCNGFLQLHGVTTSDIEAAPSLQQALQIQHSKLKQTLGEFIKDFKANANIDQLDAPLKKMNEHLSFLRKKDGRKMRFDVRRCLYTGCEKERKGSNALFCHYHRLLFGPADPPRPWEERYKDVLKVLERAYPNVTFEALNTDIEADWCKGSKGLKELFDSTMNRFIHASLHLVWYTDDMLVAKDTGDAYILCASSTNCRLNGLGASDFKKVGGKKGKKGEIHVALYKNTQKNE